MDFDISERDAVAIEAAVRCMKNVGSFNDDPVLSWLRKVEQVNSTPNTAYIRITFWAFRSPDMKKVISIVLGKSDDKKGWVPYTSFLKLDDDKTINWDFDLSGKLIRL